MGWESVAPMDRRAVSGKPLRGVAALSGSFSTIALAFDTI